MKKAGLVIIGGGGIAHKHVLAIRDVEEAQLLGVLSSRPETTDRFAKQYGIKAYQSLDEVLDDPAVDGVCLCTPSGLHTPHALEAIKRGKHVLLEKPMSLTITEADRLIAAAEGSGLKVGVISQYRFSPAVEEIRRAIDLGAFGRLTAGSLQMKWWRSKEYYASGAWRGTWEMDGGGALMNQGIHGIDIFRHLMGAPKSLTGCIRTQIHDIQVEDSAVAVVEFASGALGTIECFTSTYPGYPRRVEVNGEKGSVILDEDAILKWDLDIPCPLPVGRPAENIGASDPLAISYEGHRRHYLNFVNAILHDAPILADPRAGKLPLEIILAIYKSSREGRTVYFEEVKS